MKTGGLLLMLIVAHFAPAMCFPFTSFDATSVLTSGGSAKSTDTDIEKLSTNLEEVNATLHDVLRQFTTIQEDNLQTETTDVKESQEALSNNMVSLESSVKQEIAKVSELETSVSEVKGSQSALADDVATLQSSVTTLKGDTETSVNEIKGSQSALVKDVATLQSSVTTLKGDTETSVNEVKGFQGALVDNVETLQSSVTTLKGDMETSVNEVKRSQSALVKDVALLQSSVTTLKGDFKEVSELETSVNEVKGSQSALEDDVATLQSSVTTLKGDTETSLNEIKGSQGALVKDVATLQSSVTTLKGDMETSVNEVQGSQGALVDNVATLQSSVTTLKGDTETSVNEVKGSQSALVKDVAILQSSITTLNGDIKEVKDAMSATDAKIEDLRLEMKSDACPASRGYVHNRELSFCYKLYKVELSRDDASTICKGDTGFLISLETQAKYNHIVGYLNSLGRDAYNKGLYRYQLWNGLLSVNRGKWIWANGKTTLPRWAPYEPSRSSNRDCGQILAGGNGDIVCDNGVQPFMCEIPV